MLSEENTTTSEAEDRAAPCFVRHPDAGGLCGEPGSIEVHGLSFCEAHGEEARIGAALEVCQDAEYFFERLSNPHVPEQSPAIERALGAGLARLRKESPSDKEHDHALRVAYPEIPEDVRRRVVSWQLDEEPGHRGVLDTLLMELHTFHKLLRI